MKDWVNRHFTHSRDDEGDFGIRALIHIPVGFLIGLTFPLSYPLLITLLKYERNEDAHTEDEAWKDLFGAMIGEVIGLLVLMSIIGVMVF